MRLVGDLIGKFFTSYASIAEAQGEAFLPLDDGLSILSRHAKEIGYDGVILFLDELILWLASQAANLSFVSSEGVKLVKLVEAGNADRPIPLVSFIARQRDLREWVGDNLAGAAMHDNPGNRRRKIRELLFAELGIPDSNELFVHFDFTWRGTPREVEILYENVRELTDDRLRGREGGWTAILDFPFDDPNRTPADDIARLDRYEGPSTHTLIWLPSFLSEKSLNDLKRLVILDYILTADRFNDYAAHLSQVDRVQAKSLARNQRDQLHQRLKQALEVAYGITSEPRDAIAHPLTAQDKFRTLDHTLQLQPPVGANPREAFINLLEQVLAHEFPAHPQFETDIKPATLKKVEAELARALQEKDHRVFVADKAARQLTRALVNPLRLGNMGETHFVLELHWRRHFLQKMAEAGIDGDALTVIQLRRWIDEPRPMGLPTEVQNLIIHTFAAQTNRSFYLKKGPYQPTLENTPNELVLKEQALPRETVWRTALKRASLFFGLTLAESLNAANVAKLAEQLGTEVKIRFPLLQAYAQSLAEHWQTFGTPDTESNRLKTARGTVGRHDPAECGFNRGSSRNAHRNHRNRLWANHRQSRNPQGSFADR